jgi:hypothetical protein
MAEGRGSALPPGLKKRTQLPRGLAKRDGVLPPGLQNRTTRRGNDNIRPVSSGTTRGNANPTPRNPVSSSTTRDNNFVDAVNSRYAGGFQPYAAGAKRYGASGRDAPNVGPTSSPEGYAERDRLSKVKRNYMLKALKNKKKGKFMTPEALRTQRPGTYPM